MATGSAGGDGDDGGNLLNPSHDPIAHRPFSGLRTGLMVLAILISLKIWVEHTEFGRHIEQFTYNLIQYRLASSFHDEKLPITVVDITGLRIEAREVGGKTAVVTPRDELMILIEAIAEKDPRGIAIDVDFSPYKGDFVTADDADFFAKCLEIRREHEFPIALGIFRTIYQQAAEWLGKEEFVPLAATIRVPAGNRRMPIWDRPVADHDSKCYSLAATLLQNPENSFPALPSWLDWGVRSVVHKTYINSETKDGELESAEFLIDLSPLDALIDQRLHFDSVIASTPDSAAAAIHANQRQITDRWIILGKGTLGEAADAFSVAGQKDPVLGIYLHACSLFTLNSRQPIYELTHWGRIALDVLFAGVVIALVSIFARWYKLSDAAHKAAHRKFSWLVVFVVIAIGLGLVRWLRLAWLDFLLVCIALLIHGPAETFFRALAKLWRNFIGEIRITHSAN